MSKKRDIYNEMDSEDPFAEDYNAYYGEEVPEPEEEMPEAVDGGAFIDDEAEEDPYADYPYPEDGPYDYIDPYDPRLQEYLMSNGYMRQRKGAGGRYADFESDESVTSSSSDSESPSPSDSSSEEDSSDSSSEERVTRRKPKKTFRTKAKAKKGKQNGRKKKK